MRNCLLAAAGWAVFLFCAVVFVRGYGTRWEWGRLGMPVERQPADPINRALHASGYQQEVMWLLVLVLLVMLGVAAFLLRACLRGERQVRQTWERIRILLEQRAARRR